MLPCEDFQAQHYGTAPRGKSVGKVRVAIHKCRRFPVLRFPSSVRPVVRQRLPLRSRTSSQAEAKPRPLRAWSHDPNPPPVVAMRFHGRNPSWAWAMGARQGRSTFDRKIGPSDGATCFLHCPRPFELRSHTSRRRRFLARGAGAGSIVPGRRSLAGVPARKDLQAMVRFLAADTVAGGSASRRAIASAPSAARVSGFLPVPNAARCTRDFSAWVDKSMMLYILTPFRYGVVVASRAWTCPPPTRPASATGAAAR